MIFTELFGDNLWIYQWIILPLLICLARIADQTIGTMRLINLSKGMKNIAPVLAFFEAIIWLLAVSQILNHLDNFLTFIAYGLGYAIGNYIGMVLEEKISLGSVLVRLFPNDQYESIVDFMQSNNYGYTLLNAEGSRGPLKVIFSIVKRKDLNEFVDQLNAIMPNTFYTIEEIKTVEKGIFKKEQRQHYFNSILGNLKVK